MEYPIVYLPYLWEGQRTGPKADILFHDPDNDDCLTLDLGSNQVEKAIDNYEHEDLAEQRRLLYVAMTRASAMCNIIWAGFKSVDTSSLGTLLHPGGCKDDTLMMTDLKHLESANPLSICLETEQEGLKAMVYENTDEQIRPETVRQLPHNILPAWKISSFSAIIHSDSVLSKTVSSKTGHSQDSNRKEPEVENSAPESIRKIVLELFPKGAESGDFFHAVFENIDFTGTNEDLVDTTNLQFNRFGFTDQALEQLAHTGFKWFFQLHKQIPPY